MESDQHRYAKIALLAAVMAAAVVAYLPTLKGPFQFDDINQIVNNKTVKVESFTPRAALDIALDSPHRSRLLPNLTFAANHALAGLDPFPYHLVNLALHLAAVLAAYFLLNHIYRRLLPERSRAWRTAAALTGAAVFELHPMQTQSVAYIVQRMNVMSGLFVMASLLMWFAARESAGKKRAWTTAGFAAFGVMALLSKENAIALAALVPALDLALSGSGPADWAASRKKILAAALLAGLALALVFTLASPGGLFSGYQVREWGMAERALTQPRVVLWYAGMFILPGLLHQSIEHEVMASTGMFDPVTTMPAIAVLAGALVISLVYMKKAPLPCLGILWYLGGLALESSILPLEMAFEHRIYLPLLGIVMAVTWLSHRADLGRKALPLLALVPLLFALQSRERAKVWASSTGLWKEAAMVAPAKSRPWDNLCVFDMQAQKLANARAMCEKAASLNPDNSTAWHNLGLALYRQQRFPESARALEKAAALSERPESYYQLGRALAREGRFAESEKALTRAVELNKTNGVFWYQLGLVRVAQGKKESAMKALREAEKLAPAGSRLEQDVDELLRMAGGPP